MSKAQRLRRKSTVLQGEVLQELEALAKSFDRSETMIVELKQEMEEVNRKHQNRQGTQADINYLEDLLRCAKKKLVWEKQMEKLSVRTPAVMQKVSVCMNDAINPPEDHTRASVLQLLQNVQAAMERLEKAKVG
jgi:hypothetical protein